LPDSSFISKNNDYKVYIAVKELNYFMNNIAQNAVIRSNEIFKNFISLSENNFNSSKKNYEKIKSSLDISKLITLEGLVDLSIDESKEIIVSNFNKDTKTKVDLFGNLISNINSILDDLNVLNKHFQDLSKTFNNLQKNYSITIKGKEISSIFENFSNIFKNWGEHFKNQKNFLGDEFKFIFYYSEKELNNLNKCFSSEYNNRKENYFNSKKLYEKNIKKPNELLKIDEELSINKKLYGFFIRRYYEQFYDLNKLHYDRLKKYISLFNEKKDILLGDYKTLIDLMSFKISDIK
jgi:hypothetical protein